MYNEVRHFMPEINQPAGASANAGSAPAAVPPKSGETPVDMTKFVAKEQYDTLMSKFGSMGTEVGELRGFYKEILPLMEKLNENPALAEAIVDGKIDASLTQAIVEGKVTIGDAVVVTEAHDKVKKTMGDDKYAKATPEEIEKLVQEKVDSLMAKKLDETTKKFEAGIAGVEEKREWEKRVTAFIDNTPDFADYAEEIAQWVDEHPDMVAKGVDVDTIYYSVKGRKSTEAAVKAAEEQLGKDAKNIAANAGGGQNQSRTIVSDQATIDSLIAGRIDPNKHGI